MKFSKFVPIFCLATSAFAFSDAVYNKLVDISNYAKVAYCTVDPSFSDGSIAGECPKLSFCTEDDNDGTRIQVFRPQFFNNEISGTAYVAINEDKKEVVVVFRGSVSAGDWITDITANQCPYASVLKNDIHYEDFNNATDPGSVEATVMAKTNNDTGCEDCLVHCGVYAQFTKFINDIADVTIPHLDKGFNLTITGHSLGGGYATLGGAEFRNLGYNPLVITYAGLRVANPNLNKWIDSIFDTQGAAETVGNGGDLPVPSLSRVYQETDIVPRLPPRIPGVWDYTHSGLDFAITKVLLPHKKENVAYQGASDNEKNDAVEIRFQPGINFLIYQHIHQFRAIYLPCAD